VDLSGKYLRPEDCLEAGRFCVLVSPKGYIQISGLYFIKVVTVFCQYYYCDYTDFALSITPIETQMNIMMIGIIKYRKNVLLKW